VFRIVKIVPDAGAVALNVNVAGEPETGLPLMSLKIALK
jgi:hypothetical protein